jgi:DNA-directed RNA polymerase specialized sigma24 family protein
MGHLRLVHSSPGAPTSAHTCLEAFHGELDFLHETLRRLGAAPHEVDDLAQDVFLELQRNWPRYDAPLPLRPHLFCIAYPIVRAQSHQRALGIPQALVEAKPGDGDSGARASRVTVALLEAARIVPRQSDLVRARAIVRAHAAVARGAASASAPTSRRRARRLSVAAVACVAFAIGAASVTAALHGRDRPRPAVDAPASAIASPLRTRVARTDPTPAAELTPPAPARAASSKREPPPWSSRRSYAAELECLERAQVAFAGRDFRGALAATAEHARRFPGGSLAEEREALRVRSLAGAGRDDEARRAAATFGERFPRSVLLSRLADTMGAAY